MNEMTRFERYDEYYRILSIDGGGAFGIIPARLLASHFVNRIDMFAGTSVGSELALCMAAGMSPHHLHGQFLGSVDNIFTKGFLQKYMWWMSGPKYSDKDLNEMLQNLIPGTLGQLEKHVVVPTKDLAQDKFKVWDNIVADDDMSWPAWEIARMSSAAPTYFAPWKGHVDGGIITNNPSMIALTAAIHKAGVPLDRIRILSIGTGTPAPTVYDPEAMKSWRPTRFIAPLVQGITKSNEQATAYTMGVWSKQINWYGRFDPIIHSPDWVMDSTDYYDELLPIVDKHQNRFDVMFSEFMADTHGTGRFLADVSDEEVTSALL